MAVSTNSKTPAQGAGTDNTATEHAKNSAQPPVEQQWWTKPLVASGQPLIEESISLRVLAQLLAIVGMVATYTAALDVSAPIQSVLWAIPLSIAGSVWSYNRRYQRNVTVKFLIALGMLVALAAFFQNLIERSNDTRLILAELLIQLQALHTFDLPRRKDLGYSIMIGLILVGVAATISQTWTFAPFLFCFLAIALPVLVLDYRSRLGLVRKPNPSERQSRQARFRLLPELSLRRIFSILMVVVALGLTIFALMPRLPGYQLRTFPVSTPIDVQQEFNNQVIANPGYGSGGEGEDGENGDTGNVQGASGGPSSGPGELDSTQYYGFNTQINMNLRGTMEPQVVMRVRSQAEGYWRVMAFDRYTGQGWEVSQNEQTETLRRSRWSYRFRIPHFNSPLLEHREVIQTYTIVADELPNLIPTMPWAEDLYFPTQEVGIDSEGGLRAPLPLTDGITYSVVSEVPYRNRTTLNETNTDYAEPIRQAYLQIPEAIRDRVAARTQELLATSSKPLTTPYEQALYLAQAVKQRNTIQPDLPFLSEDQDLVETFLFDYQGGYPDHFPTALTLMLRSIGIPARLVVGYGPGEFNPFTGLYVVRNTDAYAMTEVFFNQAGWFAFDPIPGHELIPPSIEDNFAFSTLKQIWQWVAGWLPTPFRGWLSNVFLWLFAVVGGVISWFIGLFQRDWLSFLLGLILLTAIGFGFWLLWSAVQQWRHQRWLAKLPPVESLYRGLLDCLAQHNLRKPPSLTPLEFTQQLQAQVPTEIHWRINQICYAYVHWRYGDTKPDLATLQQHLDAIRKHYQRSPLQPLQQFWQYALQR